MLSTKIPNDDWQYFIPFVICAVVFVVTDVLGIIEKTNLAYWSGGLLAQPYRVVTTHFVHGDARHLLANTFGIAICRYCLKGMQLKNDYFFLLLVSLLIPSQILIFWLADVFLFRNPMSLAVGFSGVIYGADAFILLSSIVGKQRFLFVDLGLEKNYQIRQTMAAFTGIGFVWSLLPGVSLLGHLSGFAAGLILFLF